MKMFATDLDRTLIYSKRALEEMETPLDESMIAVEEKNGQKVSFMTEESFCLLKDLAHNHLLVPVTTRTFEQYKRVFIFEREIPVTYAVTNNGSKIHYKGVVLNEWEKLIQSRLSKQCIEKETLLGKVEKFNLDGTLKIADDLFFYYVLHNRLTDEEKSSLFELSSKLGWKVSLQGRKLYFMPMPVCKGEAIKYIVEREGIKVTAGAGDSILDFPFLNVCHYPFIPSHGELVAEKFLNDNHILTKGKGAIAGEEILKRVHQQFLS